MVKQISSPHPLLKKLLFPLWAWRRIHASFSKKKNVLKKAVPLHKHTVSQMLKHSTSCEYTAVQIVSKGMWCPLSLSWGTEIFFVIFSVRQGAHKHVSDDNGRLQLQLEEGCVCVPPPTKTTKIPFAFSSGWSEQSKLKHNFIPQLHYATLPAYTQPQLPHSTHITTRGFLCSHEITKK